MDAGQITQGLRADAFQQTGQGANVMQLMNAGVSFADIMLMITSNQQNMSAVMPDMQSMPIAPEVENSVNEQDLLANMLGLINGADAQNAANMPYAQELQDIMNSIDPKDLQNIKKDFNITEKLIIDNNDSDIQTNLSDVLDIQQPLNNLNRQDIQNLLEMLKTLKNIESSNDIPGLKDAQSSEDTQGLKNVQNPDVIQDSKENQVLKVSQASDEVQDTKEVQNSSEVQDTKEVQDSSEVQDTKNTHHSKYIQALKQIQDSNKVIDSKNILNLRDITDSKQLQIPKNVQELPDVQWSKDMPDSKGEFNGFNLLNNQNEDISSLQNTPNYKLNESDIHDVQNEKEIPTEQKNVHYVQSSLKQHRFQNLKNSFNLVDIQDKKRSFVIPDNSLSDAQIIQKLESFLDVQNTPDVENSDVPETLNVYNKIDISQKLNENVFNVNNLMNMQAIQIISDKLGIVKNSDASIQPTVSMQNVNSDSQLSEKLADIFSVVSPEIMKAAGNESGVINNENKFVIDLLSEISNERDRRDVFDFSESVIKVDPLQLAGLLDFISTGTGIPQAMDISDNAMFKNIDNANAAKNISGKMIFDPKEMIESGEMEIVSYIPAEKNTQSAPQDNDKNLFENGEKTIDFARTMKSVKENVKPISTDETDETSEKNSVMTAEEMNNVAEKVDISFDRAYAELEMNKTKYGSPDKQLFKGITENLKKGRSEFTVKLRPEGLGEILVKLVSNDAGKTILSMIASSEKTAQLLNRDLASLQSSLNQHNVEIENNSVKTVETVMSAQSSFDQYDERRQDEANQQNQFRKLRSKLGNISVGNVSFDNESEPVNNVNIDSALNITI